MVKRALPLLLALVLAGCPGELGNGLADAATGLIAPSGLAAVLNGGSKIALTWADRATVETGYRVEMNLSPFGTPTIGGVQFLPADATSTVYPSTPNTTYYFRVVAITGTMESDPSNVVVVTTPDVPVQPVIAARPSTPSSIGVSWSDLSNETGYVVERSSDAGATWSVAATLPAGAISWFDSGLAADTEYGYRLIAMNGFGGSTPSEPDFAQTATSAVLFYGAPFGGDYGEYTSFVVDAAGAEHIAHYDVANHRVLYSTRLGLSNYVTVTADAGPTGTQYVGGDGTSIAVDASGHVHIVAHDLTNDRLRYATNASGAWVASSIDMAPSGAKPRIACDPGTGTLHAVYQGMVPTQLKHASKAPGQPWDTTESVDASNAASTTHALALDPSGTPHVSTVSSGMQLFHGVRISAVAGWAVNLIPPPVASAQPDYTSVALETSGSAHLVFHDAVSKAFYHASSNGVSWTTDVIHARPGLDLGAYGALAVHPATGRLHAAYYDATYGLLMYARRDPGGAWVRRVIDASMDVGRYASLAVNAAGVVHIAYRDGATRRLKVAIGTP